ncbi:MAG: hypothetical protein GX053_07160 [Tissierella sp.]|nr:hypothetical protein [Tissierella sp.]
MKPIFPILFIIILLLVVFFGIGPSLIADGVMSQRLITFAIFIGLFMYMVLVWMYTVILRRNKK